MNKIMDKLVNKRVEYKTVEARFEASTDAVEIRELGKTLASLKDEIIAIEKELADAEAAKAAEDTAKNEETVNKGSEERSKFSAVASYGVTNFDAKSRATEEYRSAYQDYVQNGVISDVLQFKNNKTGKVVEARGANAATTADVGVLIPTTIMNEVINTAQKAHGQLYSRVRKLNVPNGVTFAAGDFEATFTRKGESENSGTGEKGVENLEGIVFTAKLGEIKVATSLVASVQTLELFEAEIAKAIADAYIKGMENEILQGKQATGCQGILSAEGLARIGEANVIEISAADMADWKTFQKKVFAATPLKARNAGLEFAVTLGTYEGNFKTLNDKDGKPLAKEMYNVVDNVETAMFNNKPVYFVEEGIGLKSFDEASEGEYFGLYWVPQKAYAINSNMEFAVRRYFDDNTNDWVQKALVINDGKILDPSYLFVLKKGTATV